MLTPPRPKKPFTLLECVHLLRFSVAAKYRSSQCPWEVGPQSWDGIGQRDNHILGTSRSEVCVEDHIQPVEISRILERGKRQSVG